ncbi:hypothetical protein HMPREF1430_00191, partial [Helicobacter pylori GAM96Ai]
MKKLIKMLSYSKEGRNMIRPSLLPSAAIIPKKKKRCYQKTNALKPLA